MPEPAPDLAAIDRLWHPEEAPPEPLHQDFGRLVHRNWPALEQRAERERALGEYGEHKSGCHIAEEDIFGPLDDCSCGLRAALTADPEKKEGSRG